VCQAFTRGLFGENFLSIVANVVYENGGGRFLRNVGACYQATQRHISEDSLNKLTIYVLRLSRRQNSLKCSRADSRFRLIKCNVSETNSISIVRVMRSDTDFATTGTGIVLHAGRRLSLPPLVSEDSLLWHSGSSGTEPGAPKLIKQGGDGSDSLLELLTSLVLATIEKSQTCRASSLGFLSARCIV
jgi:hypothetical protein